MLPTVFRKRNYVSPNFWDELFGDSFLPKSYDWSSTSAATRPAVNVEESDKDYLISVAAPGLAKEDLKISVNDGVLTISSENKEEKNEEKDNYIRKEFAYSTFERSFTLPDETDAEKINAKYKNGVLKVSIPKAEAKVIPTKEIKIS